jgi:hypothetical protein
MLEELEALAAFGALVDVERHHLLLAALFPGSGIQVTS